jgi:hypothetical protein
METTIDRALERAAPFRITDLRIGEHDLRAADRGVGVEVGRVQMPLLASVDRFH